MSNRADFRPALAAVIGLAVLAGAYEAAVREPFSAARPGILTKERDDSAARVNEPGPAAAALPAAPAPPASPYPAQDEEPPQPPCRPQPLRFAEKSQPGPRRYVGTVGGEWATAEISQQRPDTLSGRVYFWRSGQEFAFNQAAGQPRQLVLAPAAYPVASQAGGRWQLSQAVGPVLQGTWVDSAGRHPRPFLLRESYQGGVRYEVRQLTLRGGRPVSPDPCDVPLNRYDFLHLLGAEAARPPLSRVQCPCWAGRRRQLRADYSQETSNYYLAEVKLNDFGLLSYWLDYSDSPFEGSSSLGTVNVLLDLVSGRELTIPSQLTPGYQLPLRRLLAKRLLAEQPLHEDDYGDLNPKLYGWEQRNDQGRQVKLPYLPAFNSGEGTEAGSVFSLSAQGLQIGGDLKTYLVTIPYAELRPLVRPGTPLARMLKARGLW